MSKNVKVNIAAVDLFCGAGGLTHGLLKSGISVAAGIDLDPACKYPFETNNKAQFLHADVSDVTGSDLNVLYPPGALKVLVGCAPCQPFSRYSRKHPHPEVKWSLLGHFSRLVKETRPTCLSMENVPGLVRHPVFAQFIKCLTDMGYRIAYANVYCPDYGIPQQRTRLVLLASMKGPICLVPPTHKPSRYRTVKQTISKLTPIECGQVDPQDPLHRACTLSERNMERLRASKPGGYWREWPEDLIAQCHKAVSGHTYPSVYGRMEWDRPAPTITTQFFGFGNGRFGHPEQDRAITLREGSLLQSFPKSYRFCPTASDVTFSVLGRLIGNAVPVRLGEIIGRSLIKHIKDGHGTPTKAG